MATAITNNLASIKRYEDVAEAAKPANKTANENMGQTEFLKLFTTQLQNQNPLDPVKNEAFVAQLAQFSQLEATTNMSTSLNNMVSSMSGERMLSGAALIGKKVAVPDAPAILKNGQPVESTLNLTNGADAVRFDVLNAKGESVRNKVLGPQTAGSVNWVWDGLDDAGNALPEGSYSIKAQVANQGQITPGSVMTLSTVRSITQNANDGSLTLEVDGGKSIALSAVQRVGI
jgi:flagellar basal-body rod modification protein FlgD